MFSHFWYKVRTLQRTNTTKSRALHVSIKSTFAYFNCSLLLLTHLQQHAVVQGLRQLLAGFQRPLLFVLLRALTLLLLLLCVYQHEQRLLEVQESLWVGVQGQRSKLVSGTSCSSTTARHSCMLKRDLLTNCASQQSHQRLTTKHGCQRAADGGNCCTGTTVLLNTDTAHVQAACTMLGPT